MRSSEANRRLTVARGPRRGVRAAAIFSQAQTKPRRWLRGRPLLSVGARRRMARHGRPRSARLPGGAAGLTTVYALKPLRVPGSSSDLGVVSSQVYSDFAFAVTYDRWRLYLDLDMPFVIRGDSGTASGYSFAGPAVDLTSNPDTLTDARLGIDGRLVGEPGDAFRLGAGFQLFSPQGRNEDYDTDGTVRAMFRVLAAGDVGLFTYAAQLGVHIRPLDDSPAPGSPRGSELLRRRRRTALPPRRHRAHVAHRGRRGLRADRVSTPFDSGATGVEALLSTRVEATRQDGSLCAPSARYGSRDRPALRVARVARRRRDRALRPGEAESALASLA